MAFGGGMVVEGGRYKRGVKEGSRRDGSAQLTIDERYIHHIRYTIGVIAGRIRASLEP